MQLASTREAYFQIMLVPLLTLISGPIFNTNILKSIHSKHTNRAFPTSVLDLTRLDELD